MNIKSYIGFANVSRGFRTEAHHLSFLPQSDSSELWTLNSLSALRVPRWVLVSFCAEVAHSTLSDIESASVGLKTLN